MCVYEMSARSLDEACFTLTLTPLEASTRSTGTVYTHVASSVLGPRPTYFHMLYVVSGVSTDGIFHSTGQA